MSLWLGSGFRRLLAVGGGPGRSRSRLEAAAVALRTVAEGRAGGTLVEGPAAGGLFAEIDLARVLGQALDRPSVPPEPPLPERRPTSWPRLANPADSDQPPRLPIPGAVPRARETARIPGAGDRSRRPVFLVTPGRVMAALAPYAPAVATAAHAAGKGRTDRGMPSALPGRERRWEGSSGRTPLDASVAAEAAGLHMGWSGSPAANTRVIVSEEATAALGGILAAFTEASARTPVVGVTDRSGRDERAELMENDGRTAGTKGASLLERVLRRIPQKPPAATESAFVSEAASRQGFREAESWPPVASVDRPSRGGFRGLADRALQEGNRAVTPPLTPESRMPGEAVLDRMDAAIAASVSRILVREAERSGIDLAGGLS